MASNAPRRSSVSLGPPSFSQSYYSAPSSESLLAPSSASGVSAYVSASGSLAPLSSGSAQEYEEYDLDDRSLDTISPSSSLRSVDDFEALARRNTATFPTPSPPSPSQSFASTSSESASYESATFQLSSPFPRPPPARPRPRRSSAPGKENADLTAVNHPRLNSKASAQGFPYASSSVLLASNALVSEMTSKKSSDSSKLGVGNGKGVQEGDRSSSELDLDMSFENYPANSTVDTIVPGSSKEQEEQRQGWVGIAMPSSAGLSSPWEQGTTERRHDVPERELVRSSSGRLLGTRKRVRSAVELRAAFMAGEKTAAETGSLSPAAHTILMETSASSKSTGEGNLLAASQATLKPFLLRYNNDQAVALEPHRSRRISALISSASSSRDDSGPSSSSSSRPPSSSGFAFNATDPVVIPLPESLAISSPLDRSNDSRRSSKHFPLPLTLVDKRLSGSLASPRAGSPWSISNIFRRDRTLDPPVESPSTATTKFSSYEDDRHAPSPREQDQFIIVDNPTSSSNWVNDLAQSTRTYLGNRRFPASPTASSPGVSPIFDVNSPMESEGTSRTSPAMSDLDESAVRRIMVKEEDLEDDARTLEGRSNHLDGLGLDVDFGGTGDALVLSKATSRHSTVPSLSLSPPSQWAPREATTIDEDEDGSDSGDSAIDPTISPARRVSSQSLNNPKLDFSPSFSHPRRPLHATKSSTSSSSIFRNRNFGPPPRNLLVSETMPRPRHHQSSHSSSSFNHRFSFAPAPLSLVREEAQRTALGGPAQRNGAYDPLATTSNTTQHQRSSRRFSLISLKSLTSDPGSFLDEMVPSKLLFMLGLFLGPWCWILGGWYVRQTDGERHNTRGVRCRDLKCGCGQLVQSYSIAIARRHGGVMTPPLLWRGVDKWVFVNRIASVMAGCTVGVLVGVAISVASTATG